MPRKGGKALKSTIIELLGVTVDGKGNAACMAAQGMETAGRGRLGFVCHSFFNSSMEIIMPVS